MWESRSNMTKLTGAVVIAAAAFSLAVLPAQDKPAPRPPGLTLATSAFPDGGEIPKKYTQGDPAPVSPKLEWTSVPPNTVSFMLIMRDPDVAIRKTTEDVLHWMVFNIPGD